MKNLIPENEGVESAYSQYPQNCSCGINYQRAGQTYRQHLNQRHLIH